MNIQKSRKLAVVFTDAGILLKYDPLDKNGANTAHLSAPHLNWPLITTSYICMAPKSAYGVDVILTADPINEEQVDLLQDVLEPFRGDLTFAFSDARKPTLNISIDRTDKILDILDVLSGPDHVPVPMSHIRRPILTEEMLARVRVNASVMPVIAGKPLPHMK